MRGREEDARRPVHAVLLGPVLAGLRSEPLDCRVRKL
jgi:hypothetical protein